MKFKGIHHAWSTPIEYDRFNIAGLSEHILTYYDMNNPPSDLGNYNIFDNDCKPINDLKRCAYDNFRNHIKYMYHVDIDTYVTTMKGWVTGHGNNYSMSIHNHSGAQFSAVYYAMAEEDNRGGALVLHDPISNANRGFDDRFQPHFKQIKIQPKTNDYVIFPSHVYHHVDPFYSQFRIAIPIDLYLFED